MWKSPGPYPTFGPPGFAIGRKRRCARNNRLEISLPVPSVTAQRCRSPTVVVMLQLHELELQIPQLALVEFPLELGPSDVDVLHVDSTVRGRDLFPAPPLAMQDTMEARPPSVN
jgi:hypothetical protein